MVNRWSPVKKISEKIFAAIIAILLLYYISFTNFKLFHTIIELSCIIEGFTIFIITKNTHKVSQNNYFIFLGLCFLIVSGFDFMHLLTSQGMNIINVSSKDMEIQFRVVGKFIQAISFLVFSLLINRENKPIKLASLVNLFYLFSIAMVALIFFSDIFPKIYKEEGGFTAFKVSSEIFILFIFMAVFSILYRNKKRLHENISLFLLGAIGIFVLSEMSFAFSSVRDLRSITGHIFKLIGYYLIYKAIVQTTLENPYNVLFYRLTEINSSLEVKTRLLMKINDKLNEEIAERKSFEEKLKLSKRKYQELLDFLPYAIVTHCEGKIVYLNNAALKLFRLKEYKDALDNSILKFIHQDSIEIVQHRMIKVYNDNDTLDTEEIKVIAGDGQVISVETTAVPYVFMDKPASLVLVTDISERKKFEEKDKALKEAMEYDRIKNEFMANISHELRTPLNVIFGAIQLIEYYSQNNLLIENKKNIAKYSKSMRQNCYRMLRLVNNLIDLTKLDSGFFKLNLQNHNIINIVEDITLSVAQYIESKNINIQFDTEVEEKYIACDADMIERIVLNILSNAVKFTPLEGYIWVNIYDRGDFMLISIKDSGIGIPEDMLKIIFDRFRQVDKSLARNTEGSGIGLNLVKSLVELHEGYISVESTYGQGSEFLIQLPVKTVPWDEVAATVDIPQGKVERIHIEFSDIYS